MTLRSRLLIATFACWTSSVCFAREDMFPPMAFYPKSEFSNDMSDERLTVHLRALKEPSLWKASQDDVSAQAYRFLWLASNTHPVCVRVTRAGDAAWLRVSSHDGWPGVVAGKLSMERVEPVSLKQWEQLDGLFAMSKFWTAPAEVQESNGIADGDGLLLEGIKGGAYHVIDRAGPSTGEAYKNIGRYLLELARSDLIPNWGRRREGERKSPDYRAEPTETADSGVPDYLEERFFSELTFYPRNPDHDEEASDETAKLLW